MKTTKTWSLGLIVLMALMLVFPALGEGSQAPQLEKVFEVQKAEFLGDTDLVVFAQERLGLDGLMDQEGTVLVPNEYLKLKLANPFGYIEAVKNPDSVNNIGLIDSAGKELVPLQYGVVNILSRQWVQAITLEASTAENYDYKYIFGGGDNPYYKVAQHTFYNMNTLTAVGSLSREQVEFVRGYPGFLVVEGMDGVNTVYDESFAPIGTVAESYHNYVYEKNGDLFEVKRPGDMKTVFSTPYEVSDYQKDEESFRFQQDGKAGRLDMAGNVILPAAYDMVLQVADGYALVKNREDNLAGLQDSTGQLVIPALYDEIIATYSRGISNPSVTRLLVDGYALVLKDGKYGFVNAKGEETVAPNYAKDFANTLLYADVSGKFMLVAADGVVTELPYKEVEILYNADNGRTFFVKDEQGQTTLIDWHGQPLVPLGNYAKYDSATSNGGSFLLLKNNDTRLVEGYRLK